MTNNKRSVEIAYLDKNGKKYVETMTISETILFYQKAKANEYTIIHVKKLNRGKNT